MSVSLQNRRLFNARRNRVVSSALSLHRELIFQLNMKVHEMSCVIAKRFLFGDPSLIWSSVDHRCHVYIVTACNFGEYSLFSEM